VVTDIRMPGMDGFVLLSELRKRIPGTPVIAISGYVDMKTMMEHAFDAVIEKPVTIARLRALVAELLEEEEVSA
jgi:two-component system CheB/CheR fusion protein